MRQATVLAAVVRGCLRGRPDSDYRPWMSVKMAVVPPMPSASVRIAVSVMTRATQNCRRA